jgi:hypothetical protein
MSDKPITPMFHSEVQLAGWSESHNGGCKVTFWLAQPSDLDAFRAMTVRKGNTAGQRLACALVEIGDDEQPVPPEPRKGGELAKLAGKWCRLPEFVEFVRAIYDRAMGGDGTGYGDVSPSREFGGDGSAYARHCILVLCDIDSRSELDHNAEAAEKFHRLIRLPFAEHLRAEAEV